MRTAQINRAIRHTGLEIIHERGSGYSYFVDKEGSQIGCSVPVCYLSQFSIEKWVEEAEHAMSNNEETTR